MCSPEVLRTKSITQPSLYQARRSSLLRETRRRLPDLASAAELASTPVDCDVSDEISLPGFIRCLSTSALNRGHPINAFLPFITVLPDIQVFSWLCTLSQMPSRLCHGFADGPRYSRPAGYAYWCTFRLGPSHCVFRDLQANRVIRYSRR
jgi:hypothetical protein